MAGRDPLEKELSALRAARAEPSAPASLDILRKSLGSRYAMTIAGAAEIAASAELRELLPALSAALGRLLDGGSDPNCRAKSALAAALLRLDCDDASLLLRGVRHVQREPVLGGSVDVSVELRGACALALATLRHPRTLDALASLLVDPEWGARAHAARALGSTGLLEASAILRLKALLGDPEPQVMTEVFAGLLALEPRVAFDFVVSFLRRTLDDAPGHIHSLVAGEPSRGAPCTACGGSDPAQLLESTADAAALALGQSRIPEAFEVLRAFAEEVPPHRASVALLAIATLRGAEPIDYLVGLVEKAPPARAEDAVSALAIHRYDDALRTRVEKSVYARKSRPLAKAFGKAFGGDGEG